MEVFIWWWWSWLQVWCFCILWGRLAGIESYLEDWDPSSGTGLRTCVEGTRAYLKRSSGSIILNHLVVILPGMQEGFCGVLKGTKMQLGPLKADLIVLPVWSPKDTAALFLSPFPNKAFLPRRPQLISLIGLAALLSGIVSSGLLLFGWPLYDIFLQKWFGRFQCFCVGAGTKKTRN